MKEVFHHMAELIIDTSMAQLVMLTGYIKLKFRYTFRSQRAQIILPYIMISSVVMALAYFYVLSKINQQANYMQDDTSWTKREHFVVMKKGEVYILLSSQAADSIFNMVPASTLSSVDPLEATYGRDCAVIQRAEGLVAICSP